MSALLGLIGFAAPLCGLPIDEELMNKHLFKPVALAVTLALTAGSAIAASNFDVNDLDKNINPCQDFNGY
ncbi:MAG: hypothetical protein C4338_04790, partial [Rhodanobacteraceae bacterium]